MSGLKWVRLDTQIAHNPKFLGLVEDKAWRAISIYMFGLGYCGAHGTDGFIPRGALGSLHGTAKDAAQLVSAALWVPSSSAGWDVNGWSEYQPSSQEAKDRRLRAQAAADIRWAKHREAKDA